MTSVVSFVLFFPSRKYARILKVRRHMKTLPKILANVTSKAGIYTIRTSIIKADIFRGKYKLSFKFAFCHYFKFLLISISCIFRSWIQALWL